MTVTAVKAYPGWGCTALEPDLRDFGERVLLAWASREGGTGPAQPGEKGSENVGIAVEVCAPKTIPVPTLDVCVEDASARRAQAIQPENRDDPATKRVYDSIRIALLRPVLEHCPHNGYLLSVTLAPGEGFGGEVESLALRAARAKDTWRRSAGALALARLQGRGALPLLRSMLSDPSESVRLAVHDAIQIAEGSANLP